MQLFLFQSVGFEKICHCIAFERQFVLGGGFGGLSAADFLFLSPTLSVLFLFADSISSKVLAEKHVTGEAAHPVAMSVSWGKGEVILASTPAFYELWCAGWEECGLSFFRILSQMGGFPIVRTEGYMKETAQVQMSPFPISQRAASLGIVLEYGFHPALYDIYSPQEAAHHSGYPRTGK